MSDSELSFGITQINTEKQNAGSNCKWRAIIPLIIVRTDPQEKPAGEPTGLTGRGG